MPSSNLAPSPVWPVWVAAIVAAAAPRDALAYLDPGSGSLAIQMAIAGLLGGLFTLKTYWYQIKAWFSGKGAAPKADAPPSPPPSAPTGEDHGPTSG